MAASRVSQRAPTSEPWLTKRELADVLRCSTRTIERLRLPALRVGGQNRYRLSQVEAYLRRGERQVQLVLFGRGQHEEPET
jgi:excisionase family DNA binding protein